ncbi:unnamed protein product [Coregonus sp. 'balchen']|nr:unnamed protein product [Coregonus sp. 'balchen']
MEIKDSPVKGGISILHTEENGKHHYEVEKVLKFKKEGQGGGAFARKGDKLLMINGVNLQDLSPKAFVKILTEGNPMLTVHQASRAPHPERCPEEGPGAGAGAGALHPVSKESTMLSFSLEMGREDDLGDLERWAESIKKSMSHPINQSINQPYRVNRLEITALFVHSPPILGDQKYSLIQNVY